MTDDFVDAANLAAEKVEKMGQFERVGNTDFVVGMNAAGEHFLWDIDLLGPSEETANLIPVLVRCENEDGKKTIGGAWRALSNTRMADVLRRRKQGAADPNVTYAAKLAVELRKTDPESMGLPAKRWKAPAARKAVNLSYNATGTVVT